MSKWSYTRPLQGVRPLLSTSKPALACSSVLAGAVNCRAVYAPNELLWAYLSHIRGVRRQSDRVAQQQAVCNRQERARPASTTQEGLKAVSAKLHCPLTVRGGRRVLTRFHSAELS